MSPWKAYGSHVKTRGAVRKIRVVVNEHVRQDDPQMMGLAS